MLNKYFKADGDNNDFLYANIAVKNIYFALISLDYIFNPDLFNIGIYHDEHAYYFFHIQSILTACGNISNIFYNHFGGRLSTARSTRLRNVLNVRKSSYPLIFQKEVRNTNEHFDERYEEFGTSIGDYNLLDRNTDPFIRVVIHANPHLRTYDKESGVYHTYIRKGGTLIRFEYDLNELRRELRQLLDCITSNPLFNSGWTTEMPIEKIE